MKHKLLLTAFFVAIISCICEPIANNRILVLHSGTQRRWQAPLTCTVCTLLDVETPPEFPSHFEMVIVDGHSEPPAHILNGTVENIIGLIAQTNATYVVLATCFGAELNTLSKLFESNPGIHAIAATPSPAPWLGYSIDEQCLHKQNNIMECISLPKEFYWYTREDMSVLRASFKAYRHKWTMCEVGFNIVRYRPAYIRYENESLQKAVVVGGDTDLVIKRCSYASQEAFSELSAY